MKIFKKKPHISYKLSTKEHEITRDLFYLQYERKTGQSSHISRVSLIGSRNKDTSGGSSSRERTKVAGLLYRFAGQPIITRSSSRRRILSLQTLRVSALISPRCFVTMTHYARSRLQRS